MRVNFHRDHGAAGIRRLARIPPDLAAKLVGLAAVHAPGLRSALRLDLAEPLKEEDAAGVLRTDGRDLTGDLASRVLVGAPDMSPEILIAALALDGFARLPLLLGNLFEVTIARLIEPMIPDEHRFEDLFIPPDGDNGEDLHFQIHPNRTHMRLHLPPHPPCPSPLFRPL